jgi:hypothetical protein
VCTGINVIEDFPSITARKVLQEGNSIFLEQYNEPRRTGTTRTSKFQCPGNAPLLTEDPFIIAALRLAHVDISKASLCFPADKGGKHVSAYNIIFAGLQTMIGLRKVICRLKPLQEDSAAEAKYVL